jgi:hypothetical protein
LQALHVHKYQARKVSSASPFPAIEAAS